MRQATVLFMIYIYTNLDLLLARQHAVVTQIYLNLHSSSKYTNQQYSTVCNYSSVTVYQSKWYVFI